MGPLSEQLVCSTAEPSLQPTGGQLLTNTFTCGSSDQTWSFPSLQALLSFSFSLISTPDMKNHILVSIPGDQLCLVSKVFHISLCLFFHMYLFQQAVLLCLSSSTHSAQFFLDLVNLHQCVNQFFLLLLFFFCFEAWFLRVTLVVLELILQTRLASNSQRSAWLCLLSAGIKGVRHHRPASCFDF